MSSVHQQLRSSRVPWSVRSSSTSPVSCRLRRRNDPSSSAPARGCARCAAPRSCRIAGTRCTADARAATRQPPRAAARDCRRHPLHTLSAPATSIGLLADWPDRGGWTSRAATPKATDRPAAALRGRRRPWTRWRPCSPLLSSPRDGHAGLLRRRCAWPSVLAAPATVPVFRGPGGESVRQSCGPSAPPRTRPPLMSSQRGGKSSSPSQCGTGGPAPGTQPSMRG
jgi:hypothetical protein